VGVGSAEAAAVSAWLAAQWAAAPETGRVGVEGTELAWRGWNLAARDRPGIVLVHGFRAHARWWDHIAPALGHGFRVVAFDLSGMGDSGRRGSYARLQHGREVAAIARAQGFDRPTVIAHSYGGVISMMHARAHPQDFGRLIVIDSMLPTDADEPHVIDERPSPMYASREAALARYALRPPGGWPHPEVLAYVAAHSLRPAAGGWEWKFDPGLMAPLNADTEWRAGLSGVTTAANFIYGDRSELLTPERLAQVPRILLRAGAPIAIPACHHHVPLEQPLALTAVLRGLLADVAPACDRRETRRLAEVV